MNDETHESPLRVASLRLRRRAAVAAASLLLLAPLALSLSACRQLRQVANLRNVDFAIDDVERAELAGIDLGDIRDPDDVDFGDLGQLGVALAQGELPMNFTLMLGAKNPTENETDARLTRMDWTLLLEDRETVSGTFDERVVLPAGQTTRVPIDIRLDLLEFFERSGPDLLQLAFNIAGVGGAPKDVSLRAQPTISTPLGPIDYPNPITIDVGEVGRDDF
jgi:hypothetical protein